MSSGSKGPDKGMRSGLVQKKAPKVTAEKIVQDRELRNTRAKANMMLLEQQKAAKAMDAEEFEKPGTALKLLDGTKTKEEKEWGAWESEADPHGMHASAHADDEHGLKDEEMEGDAEAEPPWPDDEEQLDEEQLDEEQLDEEEPDKEQPDDEEPDKEQPDDEADDASGSKGKQLADKGGKGKWHNKPWWAQSKWKGKKGGGGRAGRKGQGKGKYDAWGGEYCYGGYRAVNGQFYPLLDFSSL